MVLKNNPVPSFSEASALYQYNKDRIESIAIGPEKNPEIRVRIKGWHHDVLAEWNPEAKELKLMNGEVFRIPE